MVRVTCPMQAPIPERFPYRAAPHYGAATTASPKELAGVPSVNTIFTRK